MPTSVILGLGGSPLWSAKCTYLTISGNVQAVKEGKKGSDVINQYFGIFFFIFQSSAVWGNLMSSLIFGQDTNIGRTTAERQMCAGCVSGGGVSRIKRNKSWKVGLVGLVCAYDHLMFSC